MVMMLCIGLLRRALALADPVIEAVVTFTAATGVYLCYLVYAKLVVRSDLEIAEAVGIKLPDALLSLCRKILRNLIICRASSCRVSRTSRRGFSSRIFRRHCASLSLTASPTASYLFSAGKLCLPQFQAFCL